ncbi:hypothetical protein KY312_03875 [Candidatus Woesearchaeota archaeon]|nr:hypothetical protein [Candidatus Woesearchaeota archaeon]
MEIKEVWTKIVYKLLHYSYDLLNELEKKDLDTYFGWKVKTTLKGKNLQSIVFDNGKDKGWIHIVDDLRNEMILYLLENKPKLLNLDRNSLWKKFNNKAYGYLQEKYYKKAQRHSHYPSCSSVQRAKDYTDRELEERAVTFSKIEMPVLNVPDSQLDEKEKDEIYQYSDVIVYDEKGNIIEVKKVKIKKENGKDDEFVPESDSEKEFFKPEKEHEDDVFYEEE